MRYLLLFLLALAPPLWAQTPCDNQMYHPPPPALMAGHLECPPAVYAPDPEPGYVAPVSGPWVPVELTPRVQGPVVVDQGLQLKGLVIMAPRRTGMTHFIQGGRVTTCFTIGDGTVVCQ